MEPENQPQFTTFIDKTIYLCPQCKLDSVCFPRNGQPYCENCGWPDKDFDRPGINVKAQRVISQTMEAKSGTVNCCCGTKLPTWIAFRCLYCGEYYCQKCAEIHFGKTRAEYYAHQGET